MFRVTIERIDDETGRVVASSMRMGDEEDGLGSICGCAINGINPARTDQVAAEIIEALDFGDEHPHDCKICDGEGICYPGDVVELLYFEGKLS